MLTVSHLPAALQTTISKFQITADPLPGTCSASGACSVYVQNNGGVASVVTLADENIAALTTSPPEGITKALKMTSGSSGRSWTYWNFGDPGLFGGMEMGDFLAGASSALSYTWFKPTTDTSNHAPQLVIRNKCLFTFSSGIIPYNYNYIWDPRIQAGGSPLRKGEWVTETPSLTSGSWGNDGSGYDTLPNYLASRSSLPSGAKSFNGCFITHLYFGFPWYGVGGNGVGYVGSLEVVAPGHSIEWVFA